MKNVDIGDESLRAKIAKTRRITGEDTWFGFRRTKFDFDGHAAWVVEPGTPAGGMPWTWTMQWAEAFVDRTGVPDLLKQGFHHATIDLFDSRMDESGIEAAAAFQAFLAKELGFAPKANLVGLSWGGFFSIRYAAAHPDNVRRIYLDAPLLNFDGFGNPDYGRIGAWADRRPADGAWTDDPEMPVNKAEAIAAARIPILLIYGGSDNIVPPERNCRLFAARFKKAGGEIEEIARDLFGHHPHGLDPDKTQPIVDFFRQGTAAWIATPSFEPRKTGATEHIGRALEYYRHGSDPAWGAKNPLQEDDFAVMFPRTGPRAGAPLYVVLHSAGHALQSCLDCLKTSPNHDIYMPPDDFYALFLDCRANADTDWWWGQSGEGLEETPVEKRVVATVKWTIAKFGIDPNRVYVSGNSMGGSGALGIGLPHGELFAAIKANVPAGVVHCSNRMGFVGAPEDPAERAAFDRAVAAIPDPPVLVDYSAPNDQWSKGHESLYADLAGRRYAVLGFWGDFGHANKNPEIAAFNDIIHDFAWTDVVRNAAYPVFTGASCDSRIDFVFGAGPTNAPGQVNGFFRWRNVSDTPDDVALELRIVTPGELKSRFFTPPGEATADVAIRRLQRFAVKPGDAVAWTFGAQSGEATVGADGLLALGRLTLSSTPAVLRVAHA